MERRNGRLRDGRIDGVGMGGIAKIFEGWGGGWYDGTSVCGSGQSFDADHSHLAFILTLSRSIRPGLTKLHTLYQWDRMNIHSYTPIAPALGTAVPHRRRSHAHTHPTQPDTRPYHEAGRQHRRPGAITAGSPHHYLWLQLRRRAPALQSPHCRFSIFPVFFP